MHATDLMTNETTTIDRDTTVAGAAKTMQTHNTGALAITENGKLAGIITERHLVLGCLIDGHNSRQCQVHRHMTPLTQAATPQTDIGDALLTMMANNTTCLPVQNHAGGIIGMLYSEDLYQAIEQDNNPEPAINDYALHF